MFLHPIHKTKVAQIVTLKEIMAAEVENPPVAAAEEKPAEEAPAATEAVEPAKEEVKPAEESKEVAPVKEAAPKKPTVFKQNFEKDVVYLYQFARTTSLPSLSPYVLKVETWLRLVGLKYEVSDESHKITKKCNPLTTTYHT